MTKRMAAKSISILKLATALFILLLTVQLTACVMDAEEPEPAPASISPDRAEQETLATATPSSAANVSAVPARATATETATDTPTPTTVASATPRPTTAVPSATATLTVTTTPETVEFAVIGDYGLAGEGEAAVAALIDGWEPAFIITVGDNNYPNGEAETIDANIGQYYAEYIYPYNGQYTTTVSTDGVNRFFPSLGNHDFYGPEGADPYLDYFTLPGNERYYDFVWGPVHLFALNSDFSEPDGINAGSVQAQWLEQQMSASTAPWQLVYFHVPPYSSGQHGSGDWMRWPFQAWGADGVLSGHNHHYERLLVNGIPYFVNGLGGGAIYAVDETLPESQAHFSGVHGAMRVTATTETLTFEFITRFGEVVDRYTVTR